MRHELCRPIQMTIQIDLPRSMSVEEKGKKKDQLFATWFTLAINQIKDERRFSHIINKKVCLEHQYQPYYILQ